MKGDGRSRQWGAAGLPAAQTTWETHRTETQQQTFALSFEELESDAVGHTQQKAQGGKLQVCQNERTARSPSRCFPMSLKTPAFAFLKLDIYARWEHREESNFSFNFLSPSLSLKIYRVRRCSTDSGLNGEGKKSHKEKNKQKEKSQQPTHSALCSCLALLTLLSTALLNFLISQVPILSHPCTQSNSVY